MHITYRVQERHSAADIVVNLNIAAVPRPAHTYLSSVDVDKMPKTITVQHTVKTKHRSFKCCVFRNYHDVVRPCDPRSFSPLGTGAMITPALGGILIHAYRWHLSVGLNWNYPAAFEIVPRVVLGEHISQLSFNGRQCNFIAILLEKRLHVCSES